MWALCLGVFTGVRHVAPPWLTSATQTPAPSKKQNDLYPFPVINYKYEYSCFCVWCSIKPEGSLADYTVPWSLILLYKKPSSILNFFFSVYSFCSIIALTLGLSPPPGCPKIQLFPKEVFNINYIVNISCLTKLIQFGACPQAYKTSTHPGYIVSISYLVRFNSVSQGLRYTK